jgi:hypothetical protein
MVSCMTSCLDMVLLFPLWVLNMMGIWCNLIMYNNTPNFIFYLLGDTMVIHNFLLDKCHHLLSQVVLLEN